jgi:hypothetical protein
MGRNEKRWALIYAYLLQHQGSTLEQVIEYTKSMGVGQNKYNTLLTLSNMKAAELVTQADGRYYARNYTPKPKKSVVATLKSVVRVVLRRRATRAGSVG